MRKALITGGAVRIGKAISTALLSRGYKITIHYNNSRYEAEQLKYAFPEKVTLVSIDLSAPKASEHLFKSIPSEFLPIEVLILNASVFPQENFLTITEKEWNDIISINLRSNFFLAQKFIKQLPEDRKGVIISLLDAQLSQYSLDNLVYKISKKGLEYLTLSLGKHKKIRTVGIAPGAILPPKINGKVTTRSDNYDRSQFIVQSVLFAIENEYINCEIIRVDGGKYG